MILILVFCSFTLAKREIDSQVTDDVRELEEGETNHQEKTIICLL